MIEEIILNMLNRLPAAELVKRNKEEKKIYVIEDGKIVKAIQEPWIGPASNAGMSKKGAGAGMTAGNRADITATSRADVHSASTKPVQNQRKKHKKRRSVKRLSGNLER